MNRIGKKSRKVSPNPSKLLHSQKNSAVASTGVSLEFSPAPRGQIQHSPYMGTTENESKSAKREKIVPSGGGDTGNVQEKTFLINCTELQGGVGAETALALTYGKNHSHRAEILCYRRPISRQC